MNTYLLQRFHRRHAHGQDPSTDGATRISRSSQPGGCRNAVITHRGHVGWPVQLRVRAGLVLLVATVENAVSIPPGSSKVTPIEPCVSQQSAPG